MSLKSRRGSQNLKFGGQTIPDARSFIVTINGKLPAPTEVV